MFIASFDIVSFQTIRRVVVLFGQTMPNETLPSVNRLNFLLISDNNTLSRAGASPGLLGSMMFMPGSIFSMPLHLLMIYNVVSILDNIMGSFNRYSPFAYLGVCCIAGFV